MSVAFDSRLCFFEQVNHAPFPSSDASLRVQISNLPRLAFPMAAYQWRSFMKSN
jgi:hypothetical protein